MIRVTAPIMEAQLIETYLLNKMNFSTLIATKASRVVYAARGRSIAEFGLRRAQGMGILKQRALPISEDAHPPQTSLRGRSLDPCFRDHGAFLRHEF